MDIRKKIADYFTTVMGVKSLIARDNYEIGKTPIENLVVVDLISEKILAYCGHFHAGKDKRYVSLRADLTITFFGDDAVKNKNTFLLARNGEPFADFFRGVRMHFATDTTGLLTQFGAQFKDKVVLNFMVDYYTTNPYDIERLADFNVKYKVEQ